MDNIHIIATTSTKTRDGACPTQRCTMSLVGFKNGESRGLSSTLFENKELFLYFNKRINRRRWLTDFLRPYSRRCSLLSLCLIVCVSPFCPSLSLSSHFSRQCFSLFFRVSLLIINFFTPTPENKKMILRTYVK